jgi:PIN domain nuclease of toxin-antitoxin system
MKLLNDPQSNLFLSMVTIWEMQIKTQAEKLTLLPSLQTMLSQQLEATSLQLLQIQPDHIFALNKIPLLADHRDPFDRLLIAQAIEENMPLLSRDSQFAKYPVRIIW